MFVASFVGSPAMSLVPLEVAVRGDDTVLTSAEGWELPLSPENARKARRAIDAQGGARRAAFDRPPPQHGKARAPSRAASTTVEPTGDVTFVQVFVADSVVNISLEPTARIAPDDTVWVEFDQARMHLFDAETDIGAQGGRMTCGSRPSSPSRSGSARATS